jgi:hypothetical protein
MLQSQSRVLQRTSGAASGLLLFYQEFTKGVSSARNMQIGNLARYGAKYKTRMADPKRRGNGEI